MADRLPDAKKLRVLLSAQTFDHAQYHRLAEGFFKIGRPNEALALMEKAPDAVLLERIKASAIEEGDAFTLQWIERIGAFKIAPDDWRALAQNARARGKIAFAERAEARAGLDARRSG